MNIQQLPYLAAIARSGSLSAAARELGVTQPALSRYLHDREKDVGMPLFYRERKKMYPTPAGKEYLQAIQEIQDVWDNTRRSIALLDSQTFETLRVGLSPHRGSRLLASIYPYFNREYPKVELIAPDGYFHEELERLQREEIDLILSGGEECQGMEYITLTQEEMVLGVPAFRRPEQKPAAGFQELPYARLEDFKDEVFIMPGGATALTNLIRPLFEQVKFQPQVAFSTPNVVTEVRLIQEGMGVGIFPAFYAEPNEKMLYYRFEDPVYLKARIFYRPGYVFSRAERYFLYLMVRFMYQDQVGLDRMEFCWCDFTRELVEEYDPTWAQELRREDPDYGQ